MSDRKRVVYQEWLCDPDGAILPKPPPKGQRTENGIIWGHSLEDFFWIQRIPKINVLTIWTRSMIQTITEAPQTMNPPKIPLHGACTASDSPLACSDVACAHQTPRRSTLWFHRQGLWASSSSRGRSGEGQGEEGRVGCTDGYNAASSASDTISRKRRLILAEDAPAPEDDGSKSPQSTAASSGGWSSGSGEWDAARPTAAGDGPKEGENKSPDPTTGKAKDAKEGDVKASEPQDDPTHKPTPAPPPSPEVRLTAYCFLFCFDDLSQPPIYNRLPKLEEFIPTAYFPDILYVNDPQGQSSLGHYGRNGQSAKTQTKEAVPRKYKRVWPRFDRDEEGPRSKPELPKSPSSNLRIAHLDLSAAPLLGTGNHSVVHRASLLLPTPLTGRSPTGQVLVAAKTGFSNSEARQLLQNEGKIYGAFPKHLQEDWCGYNLVAPITHPVPVGAVVPKFYGYYVPVMEDQRETDEKFALQRFQRTASYREWEKQSPILLLEECGSPIESHKFTPDERSECFSLALRLPHAEFTQNSFYVRNILRQPGPLSVPPAERSDRTPSFRIIDFGRGEHWPYELKAKTQVEKCAKQWWEARDYEVRKAHAELQIQDFNY
ncbi:hypothetical protein FB45DRAFT_738095 [Roridomyces roridus]|uniref:Uncharacterized protein n=1 Tax=Roridomyces roridus TaxID=1738132 RepID=A0AAD7FVC0_9AGAR|nr:hypothetical protein FB45DRAFT_738095 [Roridomyces roridus]